MNKIIQEDYPILEMYQALRNQLIEIIDDGDLDYSPGGKNLTLGELCLDIGEIETSYIQSFRSFKQDFSYRYPDRSAAESVDSLSSLFRELDENLRDVIESLSDSDISDRVIDRGPDFQVPPDIQLAIYREALLIFYGKCSVYLKAMGKEMPQQWQDWIA